MELDAYLARIGLSGPVRPDGDGLAAIHIAHAGAIPFENLDIQADPPRPIRLEPAAVFAKLVTARRGGYCFEQNTLMGAMLERLGFGVRPMLARIMWRTGVPHGRTHLVLRVQTGGHVFLADNGFGGLGLIAPLPLEPGVEREIFGERWRLVPSGWAPGFEAHAFLDGVWRPLYWMSPDDPVAEPDVEIGNHYTETFPGSPFVQNRIVARNTPGVRRTILNGELKIRRGADVETTRMADEAAFRSALAAHFALDLPTDLKLRPHPEIAP